MLQLLKITRPTLTKYVKLGLVNTITLPNGQYDYDKESIYKLLNKGEERKTYVYVRVSNSKQKHELESQIAVLKEFCSSNGWSINKVFQDIANSINFEDRKDFFHMMDDVTNGKVERVVITYKDRLSEVGFELFYHLFKRYNTEIVISKNKIQK